jgi:hypothetical protein
MRVVVRTVTVPARYGDVQNATAEALSVVQYSAFVMHEVRDTPAPSHDPTCHRPVCEQLVQQYGREAAATQPEADVQPSSGFEQGRLGCVDAAQQLAGVCSLPVSTTAHAYLLRHGWCHTESVGAETGVHAATSYTGGLHDDIAVL